MTETEERLFELRSSKETLMLSIKNQRTQGVTRSNDVTLLILTEMAIEKLERNLINESDCNSYTGTNLETSVNEDD